MFRAIDLALIALIAIGCGSTVRTRRPGTLSVRPRPSQPAEDPCASGRTCAVASLDADAIDVTLRIDLSVLPEGHRQVELAFREDTLGEYAEELNATPLEIEGTVAVARYRVELERVERGETRAGSSWRRPGGWHLTGRSFLPAILVDGAPIDLPATLVLETGELPLWTAAGGRERAFDAEGLSRLADEAYEVGPLVTERVEVESTVMIVASSEQASLEQAADILGRALRSLSVRLGPPPAETLLYVFHGSEGETKLDRLGSSITVSGSPPEDAIRAHAAIAELVHLWSPGAHTIAEPWLEDGVSDYLVAITLAEILEQPFVPHVALRAHRRYAEIAAEGTLREGGPWARDAGLALGFCLDAHLRESGSSLGAVLRTMLTRDEVELGAETLLEDLAAVSQSSASYLDALLATQGAFAIDDCVQRAGFRAREVSFEGWSDAALEETLGLVAIEPLVHAQGFDVREAREGSQLAVGDVVMEIEGVRTANLDDVAYALRNARPGQRVRGVVRRHRETEGISIEIPALEDAQREERAYVELAPLEGSFAARTREVL